MQFFIKITYLQVLFYDQNVMFLILIIFVTAHYLDQTGSQVYFLNPQQFIQPFTESKNMKTIQSQEHNGTIPAEIFHFIVLKDTNKEENVYTRTVPFSSDNAALKTDGS